jgi:hypothetical protein
MAGSPLTAFTDFVKFTGSAYFSSAEQFLNDAVKTTYSLPRFLKGKDLAKVVQSGENIKDDVMFDDARTYTHYNPNEEFTWTQPQVATEITVPWRFSIDHMSWTDQEIILNMPGGMTREYANTRFKNIRKKIEQRMWTSMINGMEEDLWADAGGLTTSMETEGSTTPLPYSIPAFITENVSTYHATGWTTIMGIDPDSESKWRNQVEEYDYDDPFDDDGDGDGLVDAFDNMSTKTGFMPPDFHKEHFEPGDMTTFRQSIFCSRGGLNQYKRVLRASNDTLVRKQDAAYNKPTFDGIDLVRVAQLDSATIDWEGNGAATETAASPDGYRYFWVNGNYITPIFHSERYFYKKDPFFLEKQPYTHVCPVDCWWNNFMQSRQRHGIVAPQT